MLLHSRPSTEERQPTDLTALVGEYLRPAYHGYRARQHDFTAALTTDFSLHLGSVPVIVEEVGRVLLNLFNNAFYAVWRKAEQLPLAPTSRWFR